MKLYLACMPDKYELPCAVAESVHELARMLGRQPSSVFTSRSRQKRRDREGRPRTGARSEYVYRDVDIDDCDDT